MEALLRGEGCGQQIRGHRHQVRAEGPEARVKGFGPDLIVEKMPPGVEKIVDAVSNHDPIAEEQGSEEDLHLARPDVVHHQIKEKNAQEPFFDEFFQAVPRVYGGKDGQSGNEGEEQYRPIHGGATEEPAAGENALDAPQACGNAQGEGPNRFGVRHGQDNPQHAETEKNKPIDGYEEPRLVHSGPILTEPFPGGGQPLLEVDPGFIPQMSLGLTDGGERVSDLSAPGSLEPGGNPYAGYVLQAGE